MAPDTDTRAAVLDRLHRFARIVDGRRWADAPEVFADDIVFDYGPGHRLTGLANLVAMFRQYLGGCGPSQHFLGGVLFETAGTLVITRAQAQVRHQGAGERAHLTYDIFGEYEDGWRLTEAGWRMATRTARWAIMRGDPSVLGPG